MNPRRWLAPALVAGASLLALAAATPKRPPRDLPDIVFVSRRPLAGEHEGGVPGLGPRDRTAAAGGTLMVRRASGAIRALVPAKRFFDVSDPAVSYDARRIAFAGLVHPDSGWRIWVVGADGRDLRPMTRTLPASSPAARTGRWDDFDPCWLPDGRVVFSSTRWNVTAESGRPGSNLFVVDSAGRRLRITNEHNGAEEPSVDPRNGRVVFARHWTSRYYPSDVDSSGVTTDLARAVPGERVDLWHAVSVTPDGDGMRLAGGNARKRAELMAYQPLILADGTLVGVTAFDLSLDSPSPPHVGVHPRGFAVERDITPSGAAMCAPASLPDGRLLVAFAPAGSGEYGVYRVDVDGGEPERVVDRRGWLELDPQPIVARPLPAIYGEMLGELPRGEPAASREDLDDLRVAMRFDCLNVFGNAPVDWPVPDAPPMARDVRIRFFAALSRPAGRGGDSLVLIREGHLTRTGAVHEDVTPGDVPMFEQLVGADGRILLTSTGPAHVPGFNVGRTGGGTHCIGCHTGHSAIPVPYSYEQGKRFNGATSATVTASGEVMGSHARSVVDRRTVGDVRDVAWIAGPGGDAWVRLQWAFPIAVDSLVLYGIRPAADGTDLTVAGSEVVLQLAGREVKRIDVSEPIATEGTRVGCGAAVADAVRIRLGASRGVVLGQPASGLAEIEARIRIPED